MLDEYQRRNKVELNDLPFESKVIASLLGANDSVDFTIKDNVIRINERITKTNYAKVFNKYSQNIE